MKSHYPHSKLVHYIEKRSQLEAQREVVEMRGDKLTNADRVQLDTIKNKLKALKNNKIEILDEIIFPSMANLAYFFNRIVNSEYFGDFESDIKDLLGVRRLHPNSENYAFMFAELVAAMITVGPNSIMPNFRLKLLHTLQNLIFRKIMNQVEFETENAKGAVLEDIERSKVWTEMIASRVKDEYDFRRALPQYDDEELKRCKNDIEKEKYAQKVNEQARKVFDEYTNKNSPRRTFDFIKFERR